MKILIIEDESRTAKDLAKTINAVFPEAEIVDFVESVEDGIQYFENPEELDLIFSDIQLGDGQSFDIFEKFPPKVPVIFCTAYDEYALKAFQNSGIDYILKPFSKESVEKAVFKFQNLTQKPVSTPSVPNLSEIINTIKKELQPNKLPSVLVQRGEKITAIDAEEIALFYIEFDTVFAYGFDGKKTATESKLDLLENQYYPQFYRANRQCLVNRKAVKEASQHFGRKLLLGLNIQFPEQILISKEKRTEFLDWFRSH